VAVANDRARRSVVASRRVVVARTLVNAIAIARRSTDAFV